MNKLFGFLALLSGTAFMIVAVLCYSTFSWGFVLYKLYYWFLNPVFVLPQITYYNAIGIYLFISLFKTQFPQIKSEFKENEWIMWIMPWLILGMAWFINMLIN